MSKNNWIIDVLEFAFDFWNTQIEALWNILSTSPENFKGGAIWAVMKQINGGMQAVAYGLLVLFTAISIFSNTTNFRDLRRPEVGLKYFIRFVCAKAAITYTMDIMTTIFEICGGIIQTMVAKVGTNVSVTLPQDIRNAINDTGFLDSIPLWIVSLIGCLVVIVLSFILILTVYGRFFKLYMYTAIAPLPLAAFGGEQTASHGKAFIKRSERYPQIQHYIC